MYCRSCRYGLAGLEAGRCPECGLPFDPTDPTTYVDWRYKPQALTGFTAAAFVFGLANLGFLSALQSSYGYSQSAAFYTLAGIGAIFGTIAAILAGWIRWWLVQLPLLLIGVFCAWAGLFLASDHGYRVWQRGPNPPDEAFADTAPIGFLLAGWIPGGIFVGLVFGAALLFFRWRRRRHAGGVEG